MPRVMLGMCGVITDLHLVREKLTQKGADNEPNVGGMAGYNMGTISGSYSTAKVKARGLDSFAGGFAGLSFAGLSNSYWDTATNGKEFGVAHGIEDGITGLTTAQLQAGLPGGFDPTIWAESPKINNDFPYLIANPPPK